MPTTGDDRGSGVVGPEAIERYEVEGVTYEVHPAARLFPRLEGKQFEELFFDIAMNGLREPVVVRGLEIVTDAIGSARPSEPGARSGSRNWATMWMCTPSSPRRISTGDI